MNVRKISIGGDLVGIIGLDEIFAEVKAAGESDEARLKELIYEKVKAKNYIHPKMEELYREDLLDEYRVFIGKQTNRSRRPGRIEVRVYGAGCPRCKMLDRMVMEIVAAKGLNVDYLYVTDVREIAATGILGSPALAINGKIVAVGNAPSRSQLEKNLMEAQKGQGE